MKKVEGNTDVGPGAEKVVGDVLGEDALMKTGTCLVARSGRARLAAAQRRRGRWPPDMVTTMKKTEV